MHYQASSLEAHLVSASVDCHDCMELILSRASAGSLGETRGIYNFIVKPLMTYEDSVTEELPNAVSMVSFIFILAIAFVDYLL